MKLKSILLGLASAALLAQACASVARTLDEVRADKTLNVVTTASAPPHGFKNPQSNRLEGIMVDVAAAIAKHLGVTDKLADVRAGRVDLGIVDPPSIIYQIKTKNIPGVKLDTGYQPQRKWQVGLAVQKGNTALLEAVNAALAEMKRNGELASIGQKWGVSDRLSK